MTRCSPGFTLVEILVVLVIIGLLSGIALPRLTNLYESVERAGQLGDIQGQIESLGYRAYRSGKPVVLESSTAKRVDVYPVKLSSGWRIELARPLTYSAHGICSGGKLVIIDPHGASQKYRLLPPLCRLEVEDGGTA